jgi:DNA-binding MarR family transcriptional regulator
VLVALTAQPDDRMRAYELARFIAWDKTRLSHHLKRMAARGLIAKHPCPSDRRGFDIAVTPEGRRAIEAAAPGHVDAVRRLFVDHVTEQELDTIAGVAERVVAALGCGPPATT